MNVERLHSLAAAVRDDLKREEIVPLLESLRDSLQNQVNNPTEASYQQQVAEHRRRLQEALSSSVVAGFPTAWIDLLRELGWYDLVGPSLLSQVESIFAGNDITPSIAVEGISVLTQKVADLYQNLDVLVDALDNFELGEEELTAEQAEITILIPREAVDGDLAPLGKELVQLDQILGPFLEVVTGSRPPVQVRSISSSEFHLYLLAIPTVAAEVGRAVSKVLTIYQQILDIRKSRADLENAGISEATLASIDEEAAKRMADAIEPMVTEILDRAVRDIAETRRYELQTDLRHSLNAIANRIDNGYNVDVRMGEPDPADAPTDQTDDGAPSSEELWHEIRSLSAQLQFAPRVGKPILHLPESSDSDNGDGSLLSDAGPHSQETG